MVLSETLLYSIQILSCAAMTAVIWQVQLNHYPSFFYIDIDKFQEYQRFHMRSITLVVAPIMTIEIISGVLCVMLKPGHVWYWLNLIGILSIWLATWFFSIPNHNRLLTEKNDQTIKQLIKTNWIRTLIWSMRLCLLIYLAFKN